MSVLKLIRVTIARGKRTVVADASARFAGGRLTAVIGPNGAGKSTLLAAAAGLLSPTSGSVRLDDVPIADLPRRQLAARRAYLPQAPRVDWPISVERVVALGLSAHLPAFGALPAAWQPRIDAAIARFDLAELRTRPATQLSGGELARLMLARATVGEPGLLIVDEPTAGLDPRHVIAAGEHLRALADGGCNVIVALHDLDLAARIADDIVAMKDGRIVGHGAKDAVLTDAMLTAIYDIETRVGPGPDGPIIRYMSDRQGRSGGDCA